MMPYQARGAPSVHVTTIPLLTSLVSADPERPTCGIIGLSPISVIGTDLIV